MVWSWQISAELPAVQRGLIARYHLSQAKARFAVSLTALLHDVGYVDLAEHHLPKWLHAPAGGKMVRSLLQAGGRGERIGGVGLAGDIVRAIAEHNFDDDECVWHDGPGYTARCEATIKPDARVDEPRSATTSPTTASPLFSAKRRLSATSTGSTRMPQHVPLWWIVTTLPSSGDALASKATYLGWTRSAQTPP